MVLDTERLMLRPITIDDAQDVFEYSCGKNVGINAGWKPHETIEETIEIMNMIFINQESVFGIVLKENNKLIGSVGLIKDPKREYEKVKMLGYAIGEAYWGRGYMTETVKKIVRYGFNYYKLDMISAYCFPHNKRSKHVLNKCGFVYEGTLKACEQLFTGEVFDHDCYIIDK